MYKNLFLLLLCLNFSLDYCYSQNYIYSGFVPNHGQFSSKQGVQILAQIESGGEELIFLTQDGIYVKIDTTQCKIDPALYSIELSTPYSFRAKIDTIVCIRLLLTDTNHKIYNMDLVYTDSSTFYLNYFLPTCPQGVEKLKVFQNLRVKMAKEGKFMDLKISETEGLQYKYEDELVYKNVFLRLGERPSSRPLLDEKINKEKVENSYWATLIGGGVSVSCLGIDSSISLNLEQNRFSVNASCTDTEGNLYLSGKQKGTPIYFDDSIPPNTDAFVVCFGKQSNLKWISIYGSSAYDEICALNINEKDEIYAAGRVRFPPFGYYRAIYPSYWEIDWRMWDNWKNDFPILNKTDGNPSGCMFILKMDKEGHTTHSSLYGPQQQNRFKKLVEAIPERIAFDKSGNTYIILSSRSGQYELKEGDIGRYYSLARKGYSFPVFGNKEAFLCSDDTLEEEKTYSRNKFQRQVLIKLDNANQCIWSTYLPASMRVQGLQTDRMNNVYICGNTMNINQPFLKERKNAYYSQRQWGDLDDMDNMVLPYILQFDSIGRFQWGTHIGTDSMNGDAMFVADMMVSEDDHLFICGYSNSIHLPQVDMNAQNFGMTKNYTDNLGLFTRGFVYEFDTKRQMKWSIILPAEKRGKGAFRLCSDLQGGFFLLGLQTLQNNISPILSILDDSSEPFVQHFDRERNLVSQTFSRVENYPLLMENYYRYQENRDAPEIWFHSAESSYHWNEVSDGIRSQPHLNLSPYGKLFVSGNTFDMDSSLVYASQKNAYLQKRRIRDYMHNTGFILGFNLCDTFAYPSICLPLSDTSICQEAPLSISLHISKDAYTQHDIIWNQGSSHEWRGEAYTIKDTGSYYVQARNIYNGCPSVYSDTLYIGYYPSPEYTGKLPLDTGFCVGESLTLDGTFGMMFTDSALDLHYQWQDASANLLSKEALYTFTKGGEYIWALISPQNCTTMLAIRINENDCSPKIEVPNVFTPNGDNINDYIRLKTVEQIYDFEIFVFNTWGNKILQYKGEPQTFQWDGRINNRTDAPDGAYFYIITYKDFKGRSQKQTGCIMILR